MKTIAPLVVLALLACTGCVSRYDITLSNGDVITSKGKPYRSADKNMWIYKDPTGQLAGVPAGQVSQIAPQGDSDDATKFRPASSR